MRRGFISLFSLFLLNSVTAQKINVSWNGSQTNIFGAETKKNFPKTENLPSTTDGQNVFITLNHKTENNALRVANLTWEKVTTKELFDLDAYFLPEREIAGVTVTSDKDNGKVAHILVSGFKNENGIVYRLSSFEILPEQQFSSAKRVASSMISSSKLTTENPLKIGNFYKIKVDKSGVFKITTKFLKDNGINPANINPKNFRIYGNGGMALPEYYKDFHYETLQENAIQVVGEEDGKWDDGDYALFYAQGPHGFNVYKNSYNNNIGRTETRTDTSLHFQNIYDDYGYYFINFDKGEGSRIQTEDTALPNELITRYDAYQFIDEDKTNLLKLGRLWVADAITNEKTISFKTNSPINPADEIYYKTSVVNYNAPNTNVNFNINRQKQTNYAINYDLNVEKLRKVSNFKGTVNNLSGNEITISILPNTAANPNGIYYFDYAEVMYKEDLKYNDAQMNFRSYGISEGSGVQYGFSLSNATGAEQVWNVSNPTNVTKKVNKSGNNSTFDFGYLANTSFQNEFVAFKNSAAYTPTFVGKVENTDLASLLNTDYLIITQKEMFGEAKRLADYHSTKNGFKTEIVDVENIYNEYSSGGKDITAIRNFIYNLKNNGSLKYVLLLGDTSYDYKNKTTGNDNIIPSYQSEDSGSFGSTYVTDDYFVMVNPNVRANIATNLPELPIGRLPASNVTEAKNLIDKTLAYYNALPGQSSPFGEWRMNLDFIADDNADGKAPFHNIVNDAIQSNFESGTLRSEYHERKLYLDAFPPEMSGGGQRYPQVNQAINNNMANSLFMFYFGHGGTGGWAQERILTLNDTQNFNNFNSAYSRFPFVSTMTCEFTLWDNPEILSAGEQLMKLKTGGPAAMITSSRELSVSYAENFTNLFTTNIFEISNNEFSRLGDAHLQAKKLKGLDINHLKVNFLGDPAMKLSRPKPFLTIDNIESPVNGQLRALDFVKVSGQVNKEDGTLDTNFNGRVSINIFDKTLTKKTRNNDGNLKPELQYQEEGNPIVKASGKAINGKYTVEFYVPKDINYEIGTGRILGYADNFETAKANAYDVFGTKPYQVGGINPDGLNDNQPPKVNLYMNNTNFADGGITNANPVLLACVSDDTGINSTGSGIGHDITVVLDGKVVDTTVLNDFFTSGGSNGCNSELKAYQKGSVSYPFRNLSPGNHQLVFKVWDINNNSTTATLNFVVKDEADQKLVLNKLLNWPNPFTDKTYIQFEHNCDDILDVNIQIYTITGKLVRSFSQPVVSEPFLQGFRTPRQSIEWDGKDDFGATVGKGTYIFKVYAKSPNQDKCKGGATAVEKMVLLK